MLKQQVFKGICFKENASTQKIQHHTDKFHSWNLHQSKEDKFLSISIFEKHMHVLKAVQYNCSVHRSAHLFIAANCCKIIIKVSHENILVKLWKTFLKIRTIEDWAKSVFNLYHTWIVLVCLSNSVNDIGFI